uniref:ribosomal protein L4 n=1 Tax=Polyopes affinis TaxID=194519 RepID=UPI002A8301B9|nr:ribosomal protein L4 [Polyopes affinis]WOL37068.1 ribosomal protein L4 [Polyopes affinis]
MIKDDKLKYSVINENNVINKEITLKIDQNNNKKMYIIHRALVQQLNAQRKGNACTKTRSEVRGGGRKPWKQKGTGRARAGSIRSPLWKGGGIIFGPKTKKYIKKINKKEKKLALEALICNKFKDTIVTENFCNNLTKPNTKNVIQKLQYLGISIKNQEKILIIVKTKSRNLYLSIRNLKNIELIAADQINILSIIKANKLLITLEGLNKIKETYNG